MRLKGNQFIVAGGALFASAEFDLDPATTNMGGNGGEAASPIPVLTAAYVHSFTERFKFGAALFGAAGAALEYEPTWAGRRQSQRSEILALSLSPTLAYRVSDWFSFGAGVNIIASALDTQVGGLVPTNQIKIDGSDTQISYNASLMFEPGDKTRIGVSYVSETEFDYAGDITRTGVLTGTQTSAVNTTLTLAQVLRVGLHYDISPKAAIVGTLGWEDWSALESQFITHRHGDHGTPPAQLGRHLSLRRRFPLQGQQSLAAALRRELRHLADAGGRPHGRSAGRRQLRLAGGFQNVRSEKFSWGAELLYRRSR